MSLKGGVNGVLRSRVIGHRDPASFANSRAHRSYQASRHNNNTHNIMQRSIGSSVCIHNMYHCYELVHVRVPCMLCYVCYELVLLASKNLPFSVDGRTCVFGKTQRN